jgi:lactoylglutathione lyase
MTETTQAPSTITNIGVTMFSVTDVDAAVTFYTEKLGFEVRADARFGPEGENRWLEVAPPGSTARLSLNLPMTGDAGGGSIGVETTDVLGEHRRLRALGGVDLDPEPMSMPGAPSMFSLRDPDGNYVWVVDAAPPA